MRIIKPVAIAILVLSACSSHALIGQTMQDAEKYYGKPIGEILNGNSTIRMYKRNSVTITETYDEQGICIKSEADISSPTSSGSKQNYSGQRSYYVQKPEAVKAPKQKTPEETYVINAQHMWILGSVNAEGFHRVFKHDNGKRFYVVDIRLDNRSARTFTVMPWHFHIIAKDKSAYQGKWFYLGNAFDPQELPPGTWSHGYVIFEIPFETNYNRKELDRLTFEYARSRYINTALPVKTNVEFMP